jgi:hypothetical protein
VKHKKTCKDCGLEKSLSHFYASPRANGVTYYASYCKTCAIERSRINENATKEENYLKLWLYFQHNPCVDCGETNPLKLSLDHRDTKNHDVSNMMKKKWRHIERELALTDTRCHNCHAVKTHASLGHFATESLRAELQRWPDNAVAFEEYK